MAGGGKGMKIKSIILSLSSEDVLKVVKILLDEDKEDAFKFIKEVLKPQVDQATREQ